MRVVEAPTPEAHPEIIAALSEREARGSRIGGAREELAVLVSSDDPRRRYLFRDDDFNLAFQLQEHWAYWAGANPGHVQRYNTNMEEWLVDGELPGSAYGDRLRNTIGHDQIDRALRQIRESPETRRAMMMVHQPATEDYGGEDVACTAYLHPFLRDGELHMVATIRSQDMHWGYPYDTANNQFIQEVMAGRLGADVGSYWHLMDSAHYYTDFEEAALASVAESEPAAGVPIDVPDGRIWADDFGLLTEGLAGARRNDVDQIYDALDDIHTAFVSDWLKVMTAYEYDRFHGQLDRAEQFASWVQSDDWRSWITDYVGNNG